MAILVDIAAIITPLFLIAGIGLAWGRSGHRFDTNMIGALSLNFGVPCLIFSTMTKLQVSLVAFGSIAGLYTLAVLVNLMIAAMVLRLMKLDVGAYVPGITFANNGNMGLPLCLFAFGDEGLVLGISIFVISFFSNFILGVAFVSGRMTLGEIAKTPAIYVVMAALLFLVAGIDPPRWLANTTEIIGGMSIPLMLLALGVSLSRLKVGSLGRSLILALLRLGVGFTIGYFLAWSFDLEGVIRGVLILQCAMPAAVFNYILAVRYNRAAEEVAGLIVASTVISFLTLPLLLYVVI
ncbi:AEC family transporter [Alphaproteobacteria bacterium]|nr:AEC family transporter [Alphaproteobacteria bacterium]